MVTAVNLFGSSRQRAMVLADESPLSTHVLTKGVMDSIYPWWWDEREFPRRAVMTEWFYNPLKGQPRYVDIYHMRQMASSEWVFMCTSTIIEEIAQVPWEIIPKNPSLRESPPEDVQDEIDYVTYFLNNPNDNKGETINTILRALIRDSLEIDAASVIKGFSEGSYEQHPAGGLELRRRGHRQLVEMYARDGGSFLKEVDVNGVEYRYWQYSYLHPAIAPIEFDCNEIAYVTRYPRSYSVYGWAELQSMETVLNCLINSAFTNATMFQDYAVPSGVISFTGTQEDEKRLAEYFRQEIKGRFHKVAVLNRDAKFTPIAMTNRELEFIKGQQWFAKLVWALYKLTPTELGFQDEIRETGKAMNAQAKLNKRKAVMPLLAKLEEVMNNQIVNELSDRVIFKFQYTDKEEEMALDELTLQQLDRGLVLINEVRKKRKLGGTVRWGDIPLPILMSTLKAQQPSPFGDQNPQAPPEAQTPNFDQMQSQGVWGGRSNIDYDTRGRPVHPVRAFNPRDGRWSDVEIPYTPQDRKRKQEYWSEKVRDYGPHKIKEYWEAMGALGQRPDEPQRDGMLLPGEMPRRRQEERLGPMQRTSPHRTGPHDEYRGGGEPEPITEDDQFAGGQGVHEWLKDEANQIAMDLQDRPSTGTRDPDQMDRLAPARRVTDPLTDPETRIEPTPPIRAGPKQPRSREMAKSDRYPKRPVKGPTPATGPRRTVLGVDEYDRHVQEADLKSKTKAQDPQQKSFQWQQQLSSTLQTLVENAKKGILTKDQAMNEAHAAIINSVIVAKQATQQNIAEATHEDDLPLPTEQALRFDALGDQWRGQFKVILADALHLPAEEPPVPEPEKKEIDPTVLTEQVKAGIISAEYAAKLQGYPEEAREGAVPHVLAAKEKDNQIQQGKLKILDLLKKRFKDAGE